jgi:quercetin dioxygenase-like cupin family protein
MDIIRDRSSQGRVEQRHETFTGSVWGESLLAPSDGVAMSTVYFGPGARSYWHRHDGGQILQVTSGEGLIVARDGSVARVRAGDLVWAPPGEEHWHGARSDSFLVHTTVTVGATAWLDEVTADHYRHAH